MTSRARRTLRQRIQPLLRSVIYGAFVALTAMLRILGPRLSRMLARGIGGVAGRILPFERRIARENLERALPEYNDAERAAIRANMFKHFGESAIELLFVERIFEREGGMRAEGINAVRAAIDEGRGAIIVTGHLGNWEILAAEVARAGMKVSVVARRIYDPRFDRWMQSWRARFGIETIVRDDPSAIRSILRALKDGHVLGILIDQDTDVPSVWVPFFGREAKTPNAAGRLAARGIPLFFAADRREGPWRHVARFAAVEANDGDERATTARLSVEIEEAVRAAPEQWVWLHQRWRSAPPTDERNI